MNPKIWLFALLLLFSVLGYDIFKLYRSPEVSPELNFTTITGKQFSLNSIRGKPVLITFWATDCPSCIKEIPHLIELYESYHPKGLEIIAIAMAYNPPNYVVAMTKEKALPYDVVFDLNGNYAHAFGDINLTPNSFLIAPDGSIILHKLGLLDLDKMKTAIEELIK